MKTTFVKLMCLALSVVMLASVAVLTARAADPIVNLYDESKSSIGIASAKDGDANGNQNYHSSAAIEVSEGDKITMGVYHSLSFVIYIGMISYFSSSILFIA